MNTEQKKSKTHIFQTLLMEISTKVLDFIFVFAFIFES